MTKYTLYGTNSRKLTKQVNSNNHNKTTTTNPDEKRVCFLYIDTILYYLNVQFSTTEK